MANSQANKGIIKYFRRHLLEAFLKPNQPEMETYETRWDHYVKEWRLGKAVGDINLHHPGDEWAGIPAGLNIDSYQYSLVVYEHFIKPYVSDDCVVLEIGSGGGRMTQHLIKNYKHLICTDISVEMLKSLKDRFKNPDGVEYIKTGGVDLDGVKSNSIDVVFSWATFIRLRPYDIYAYLQEIHRVLKPGGTGILHHANILSELGWKQFVQDVPKNILMRNDALSFSVMTPQIMEKFLGETGFELIKSETEVIPRDCISIFSKI